METMNNNTFEKAVEEGDVRAVQIFLDQEASLNYSTFLSLLQTTVSENHFKIIELLVKYGITIDEEAIECIFKLENGQQVKEIMTLIVRKDTENIQRIKIIYSKLVKSKIFGQLALDILILLLDCGLPDENYIVSHDCIIGTDKMTPLQYCITERRADFVSVLLERGADVNKKSLLNKTCLWLAINHHFLTVVGLLLKKGARINDKGYKGQTALHLADYDFIPFLLDHGADLNILNDKGETPLSSGFCCSYTLMKEIAKMNLENQPVCPENMEYIQIIDDFREEFDDIVEDLKELKNIKIYSNITAYDILLMRKEHKKMFSLTKNQIFVAKYTMWQDQRKLFAHYDDDLEKIFKKALEKSEAMKAAEAELYSIFKDYLPELTIRRVAYFVNEDLFFE